MPGYAAVGVRKIERDRAVLQILSAECVEARVLIVDAEAELPAADGRGALGKCRTKTFCVAGVKTRLLVEAVREASGRRSQREIRELRPQPVAECFDRSDGRAIRSEPPGSRRLSDCLR